MNYQGVDAIQEERRRAIVRAITACTPGFTT